jgi:hypothetical protein
VAPSGVSPELYPFHHQCSSIGLLLPYVNVSSPDRQGQELLMAL